MKPLDQHRIFQLFTDTISTSVLDNEIYTEPLYIHPYIKLGMVIRGVENFFILDGIMRYKHRESYERIQDTVQQTYFERLFNYLEGFDEKNYEHILESLTHDNSSIHYALTHMISHFENLEEYEKCARLLAIRQAFFL
jgi:hypothetical protein